MTSSPTLLIWLLPAAAMALVLIGFAAKAAADKLQARSRELQEQDELLARRCDELDARIDQWITRDRIDHLSDLVRAGARGGRLKPEVAEELESYLQDLRSAERSPRS